MLKSMTGYGKAVCQVKDKALSIELRSLNSKNLDISLKLPFGYREKENEIRALLSIMERGKIELSLGYEGGGGSEAAVLNTELLGHYYRQITEAANQNLIPHSQDILSALLKLPDVLRTPSQEVEASEWEVIFNAIKEALDQADAFRISEGNHLAEDLKNRIESIALLLAQVEPLEAQRNLNLRQRLLKGLNELRESGPDINRFEQELIYYIEKLDISEEKVRLRKHLEYFSETMQVAASGKKLGFIAQEIGREINTLGSKANDAAIQRIVVEMKDELEKIKEQLMNIL